MALNWKTDTLSLDNGLKVSTSDLLNEIKKRPILYDEVSKRCSSVRDKQREWIAIAETLVQRSDWVIVAALKMKWKTLRDSFVRARKNENRVRKSKVRLGEMSFLLESGMLYPGKDNSLKSNDSTNDSDNDSDNSVIEIKDEQCENDSDTEEQKIAANTSVVQQHQQMVDLDEMDKFFLSLAHSVKQLQPLNQAQAKKDIANAVFDMELQEANNCPNIY